jgi:hypothetical protein
VALKLVFADTFYLSLHFSLENRARDKSLHAGHSFTEINQEMVGNWKE